MTISIMVRAQKVHALTKGELLWVRLKGLSISPFFIKMSPITIANKKNREIIIFLPCAIPANFDASSITYKYIVYLEKSLVKTVMIPFIGYIITNKTIEYIKNSNLLHFIFSNIIKDNIIIVML